MRGFTPPRPSSPPRRRSRRIALRSAAAPSTASPSRARRTSRRSSATCCARPPRRFSISSRRRSRGARDEARARALLRGSRHLRGDLGAHLQLAIVGRLLGRFGPGFVLAVLPLVQATGISLLAIAPSLTALAVVQILGRSATRPHATRASSCSPCSRARQVPREERDRCRRVSVRGRRLRLVLRWPHRPRRQRRPRRGRAPCLRGLVRARRAPLGVGFLRKRALIKETP